MTTFTNKELEAIRLLVVKTRNSLPLQKKTGLGLVEISEIVEKIDTQLRQMPSSKLDELEKDIFDISIEDDYYLISDTQNDIEYKIQNELIDSGKITTYTFEVRDQRIEDIEDWIGESTSEACKSLMREDLEYLRESSQEIVFGYSTTNGYVAKDVDMKEFNKICQEIIESYKNYTNSQKQ